MKFFKNQRQKLYDYKHLVEASYNLEPINKSKQYSLFDLLPNEIFKLIFDYLEGLDFLNASIVSRSFYKISESLGEDKLQNAFNFGYYTTPIFKNSYYFNDALYYVKSHDQQIDETCEVEKINIFHKFRFGTRNYNSFSFLLLDKYEFTICCQNGNINITGQELTRNYRNTIFFDMFNGDVFKAYVDYSIVEMRCILNCICDDYDGIGGCVAYTFIRNNHIINQIIREFQIKPNFVFNFNNIPSDPRRDNKTFSTMCDI
jgi:hypothetical protein